MTPATRVPSRAVLVLVLALTGCGDEGPTQPALPSTYALLLLNSTGQTLAPYAVEGDEVIPDGGPIDLGPGFDGDGLAVGGEIAAMSVSSFGGSRIVRVDLLSGAVSQARFPDPDGTLTNPSRPTIGAGDTLWVGGRGSDAVYRIDPGASEATPVASDVGTFVERVLPGAAELYAIDANLDDDGLTYAALGPGRVVVLDRSGAELRVLDLPAGAPNPTDGVLVGDRLFVLAGGTFDPVTFAPSGDGALVLISTMPLRVTASIPLEANGNRMALGADGRIYITTTRDYASLDLLRFDPRTGGFERGPSNPLLPRDGSGARVECWIATALFDGRILCSTFRTDAAGRFLLLDAEGVALSETSAGFGSTDIAIRP